MLLASLSRSGLLRLRFLNLPPLLRLLAPALGILPCFVVCLASLGLYPLQGRLPGNDHKADDHQDNVYHICTGNANGRYQDIHKDISQHPAFLIHQLQKGADQNH